MSDPLTEQKPKILWGGLFFIAFFFLFPFVMLCFLTIIPVWKILWAGNWTQTACVVESSEVRREDRTSKVHIVYHYQFQGKSYKSNRYNFSFGSSAGYDTKVRIVVQYPAGSRTSCYVDPANPSEAVLDRGFFPELWYGLIPGIFVLICAWVIVKIVVNLRRAARPLHTRTTGIAAVPEPSLPSYGPVVLKPAASPLTRVISAILGAAVWNGLVWSGIVWIFWPELTLHNSIGILGVVIILFALAGVYLAAYAVYMVMAFANPRPRMTVDNVNIFLGGHLDVAWEIPRRSHVVRRMCIFVEGREEVTFDQKTADGTETRTETKAFMKISIVEAGNPAMIAVGRGQATFPDDTMPSFKSKNNQVAWFLVFRGDIRWWPDIELEYAINLLPLRSFYGGGGS